MKVQHYRFIWAFSCSVQCLLKKNVCLRQENIGLYQGRAVRGGRWGRASPEELYKEKQK